MQEGYGVGESFAPSLQGYFFVGDGVLIIGVKWVMPSSVMDSLAREEDQKVPTRIRAKSDMIILPLVGALEETDFFLYFEAKERHLVHIKYLFLSLLFLLA